MKTNKHSHINADEEQKELLDLQRSFDKTDRPISITLCALFFAFIFVFAVLFWAVPDKTASEKENRSLTTAPKFSFSALADGTYTSEFADYMADQFPFRNFFIGLKAASERVLLKGQNNGVIIADDGYLVTRYDTVDEETLRTNISCIAEFMKKAPEKGVSVTFAAAGRTMDVACSKVSSVYGSDASDKTWALFDEICKENGVEYTDLKTPLKEHFENGEYVYYRTDHHWTSLGAYYALCEIAKDASLEVSDINDFERECVSEDFYGTTWSSAGINSGVPDSIELFRFDSDERIVRRVSGSDEALPLYEMSSLETKDKYSVFIGGNSALVTLEAPGENREKILIVKDSFAHSAAPILAKNYDLVIADLRYYSSSLWELCESEDIKKVILIYNMDTLSEESGFRMFKADSR